MIILPRIQPWSFAVALLAVGATICSDATAAGERPRFALLIGVGQYSELRASEQLDGCENDVAAMKAMLQDRFGFAERDIVTLLNAQATGDSIRRAMRELQQRVAQVPADSERPIVVFHFSGHGSQVIDQLPGNPDCDEEDGLDETLVPHDAAKQGGEQDIRDDEIYAFVDELCGNGRAKLWMVMDCCHSGTGARGVTKIRKLERRLPVTNLKRPISAKRLPPGAIFLSACRAQEVEPEYWDGEKTYGLLTRFLVELLNEENAVSRMSYDLLRESIVARYRGEGGIMQAPMPTLEYGDAAMLEESVIDGEGLDRNPLWQVELSDNGLARMNAGSLHGITVGSLYEVYASPASVQWELRSENGNAQDSLVWLEIESVAGGTCLGRPFHWSGDVREVASLPSGFRRGYAIRRYKHHGGATLKVRIVRAIDVANDGPPLALNDPKVPAPLRDALLGAVASDESPWLENVQGNAACDVLVRVDGDYAAIFPATGVATLVDAGQKNFGDAANGNITRRDGNVPASLRGGWGPIDLRSGDTSAKHLREYLRKIIRARNLISIASKHSSRPGSAIGMAGVRVRVEVLAVDAVNEDFSVTESHVWQPDSHASAALTMSDGDRYTFRVVNEEAEGPPVFVTVLRVDSNMSIEQIHPWQPSAGATAEGEQRLEAGRSLLVPGFFVCNGDESEPPEYGQRYVVVLATRAPNQFHRLAQGGLPVSRSDISSLEGLLIEQTELKTLRGVSLRRKRPTSPFDDSWGAMAVRWNVIPLESPRDVTQRDTSTSNP